MKKLAIIMMILLMLPTLVACEGEEVDPSKLYQIYYISKTESKVEIHEHIMEAETPESKLEELIGCLAALPDNQEYKAPLNMGFHMLEYELESGKLRLNMDESYRDLSPITEVLVRAAIVRTLTQLEDVNFVGIAVNDTALFDRFGRVVGWMGGDQFLNNPGSEINSYEDVRLTLYFANEEGNSLIVANRTKPYNGNISMERLIVEELIRGPSGNELFATINPDTRIIGVTVKDGTCYVNLDDTFLTTVHNVIPDVTIYSIVNSLAELSNVNKVQFAINGDSSGTYRERFSFSSTYERNLDIVLNIRE